MFPPYWHSHMICRKTEREREREIFFLLLRSSYKCAVLHPLIFNVGLLILLFKLAISLGCCKWHATLVLFRLAPTFTPPRMKKSKKMHVVFFGGFLKHAANEEVNRVAKQWKDGLCVCVQRPEKIWGRFNGIKNWMMPKHDNIIIKQCNCISMKCWQKTNM